MLKFAKGIINLHTLWCQITLMDLRVGKEIWAGMNNMY